jgi:hypothetical protein
LFSGNSFHGLVVRGSGTVVKANRMIGNGQIGLALFDADAAVVGGTLPGEGNQLGANLAGIGIVNAVAPATPTIVRGNLIGTQANGIDPLPNVQWAVYTSGEARAVIGGVGPSEANVIANGVFGVVVNGNASVTIRGNSIYNQGFQAIDLNEDGPTANDPLDTDVGPNQLQNFPGVSGVTTTTVAGELFAAPLSSYTIDFYSSPVAAHGRTWVASISVDTDAAGHAFIPVLAVTLTSGHFVRATATDAAGNTSELSAPVIVP